MAASVKAKQPCCGSNPRCKRCPVVLARLEKSGSAERIAKRKYRLLKVTKKRLKAARAR